MQGVARHWRNPVRTRVTPLDSGDALYIGYLAYTVKFMDNVVFSVPVRFTHAPSISLTCAFSAPVRRTGAFYARTYYWLNLCVGPVHFAHATIVNSTCAFLQHLCVSPVRLRTPL